MISSSLSGTSGLSRTGGTGGRSRMAWKIIPEVSPLQEAVARRSYPKPVSEREGSFRLPNITWPQ